MWWFSEEVWGKVGFGLMGVAGLIWAGVYANPIVAALTEKALEVLYFVTDWPHGTAMTIALLGLFCLIMAWYLSLMNAYVDDIP